MPAPDDLLPLIEAVIFDCDGTLVDSLPLVAEVLTQYLGGLDLLCSVEEAVALFGSGRLDDSVAALEARGGRPLPADFVPELHRRRDDRVRQGLQAVEGALELVGSLRVPIAVASNAPFEQTRLSLEVTGLLRYFTPHVFSAHDVGSWKPDPGLFLHAAAALDVEPSRCLVVEDSALGIQAGLAAGMTVLALADANVTASGNVRSIASLTEVRLFLGTESTTSRTAGRRNRRARER